MRVSVAQCCRARPSAVLGACAAAVSLGGCRQAAKCSSSEGGRARGGGVDTFSLVSTLSLVEHTQGCVGGLCCGGIAGRV
jgi:hypothetical protein